MINRRIEDGKLRSVQKKHLDEATRKRASKFDKKMQKQKEVALAHKYVQIEKVSEKAEAIKLAKQEEVRRRNEIKSEAFVASNKADIDIKDEVRKGRILEKQQIHELNLDKVKRDKSKELEEKKLIAAERRELHALRVKQLQKTEKMRVKLLKKQQKIGIYL